MTKPTCTDNAFSPVGVEAKPKLAAKMEAHREWNEAGRPPRLRTADISITSRCNFRCRHCYAADFLDKDLVSLTTLERTIAELRELGVFHFIFQGGEAITDMERLRAMVAMAGPDESYINVVSNGWALTEEVIRELKAMGVDKITVSLDSGDPAEHDHNRNREGSQARAKEALRRITALGMHTSFSTTISHANLHTPGIQALFAFSEANSYRMDIQVAAPVGRWEGRYDLVVTPEDAAYLKDKVDPEKRNWNRQPLVNRDIYPRFGKQGCPAAKEFVSISPTGHFFPCTFIHTSFGNIADRSVAEMREEMLRIPWFADYHPCCLCGEELRFIKGRIARTYGRPFPASAKDVYPELGAPADEPEAGDD